MRVKMTYCLLHMLSLLLLSIVIDSKAQANVTYDGRSLIINGQRKILFSGSIHYPRSTPEMWPSLIKKAKEGGLDVIQTYVFWNLHEPQPGQYDFDGRADLVRFIKEIQAQGLYASLRIGPFIEAEWTHGGLPIWLRDIPNVVFRTDNEPFKAHMQNFTTLIVNMMKAEKLFASQGGPIIISQIENEYRNIEGAFGAQGPAYVKWAAAMAVGQQTGVPWVMCKQDDAPDPVINACNGMKCGETFHGPNSPNKPALWTENWTSFLQGYGEEPLIRSAQALAYHVALFIAKKNGSFVNYYMYHGGTNFGRTGASYMITSYYDEAPLDEYGLPRQPKYGHLKQLHEVVKSCSDTLLSAVPTNYSLGTSQEAYVFKDGSGKCAAFLMNYYGKTRAVIFQNMSLALPPSSISILPDCKTVAFNTGKVNTQSSRRVVTKSVTFDSDDKWTEFRDDIPVFGEGELKSNTLLDQISTTKDTSDYLWYTLSFESKNSPAKSSIEVNSTGHVLRAFVNGAFVGSAHGGRKNGSYTLKSNITVNKGTNNISLLSVLVGLPDGGAHLEKVTAGPRKAKIRLGKRSLDLTNHAWGYQVGLNGETLKAFSDQEKDESIKWKKFGNSKQPLTWYKTTFDAPQGDDPLALNLASMGKGEAWVNGQSIGRYWVSFLTPAGHPSQTWYHIPRSFLKPTGNSLVVLEEENGDPKKISIDNVSAELVNANSGGPKNRNRKPQVQLQNQLQHPTSRRLSTNLHASNRKHSIEQNVS